MVRTVVVLVTFLLWLNTEKSLLSCVAVLRLGLVRSDMTVVTRDRRTVLDNILTITVRPLLIFNEGTLTVLAC